MRRKPYLVASLIVSGIGVLTHSVPASAESTENAETTSCTLELYEWTGKAQLQAGGPTTYDTGVVVPGPAAGETLRVVSGSGTAFDLSLPGNPTRAEVPELNERWTFSVGGQVVGPLSNDLPDSAAQGAVDDTYSGIVGASFGSAATNGGAIALVHAAQLGQSESNNSFYVTYLKVKVERCVEEVPPTTVEEPPTTVEEPPTTVEEPPTTVEEQAPPTTEQTAAATPDPEPTVTTVSRVAAAAPVLPSTGSDNAGKLMPIAFGSLLLGTGIVLATRRRPA